MNLIQEIDALNEAIGILRNFGRTDNELVTSQYDAIENVISSLEKISSPASIKLCSCGVVLKWLR